MSAQCPKFHHIPKPEKASFDVKEGKAIRRRIGKIRELKRVPRVGKVISVEFLLKRIKKGRQGCGSSRKGQD